MTTGFVFPESGWLEIAAEYYIAAYHRTLLSVERGARSGPEKDSG